MDDGVEVFKPDSGGPEISFSVGSRALIAFNLVYPPGMTDTDQSTLSTYERVTAGYRANWFSWTHPLTSVAYTVKLAGAIDYIPQAHGGWQFSVPLKGYVTA